MVRLRNGVTVPPEWELCFFREPHYCVFCGLLNAQCYCNAVDRGMTVRRHLCILQISGTTSLN